MKDRVWIVTFAFLLVMISGCISGSKSETSENAKYEDLTDEEKHQAQNAHLSFTTHTGLAVKQFAAEPMLTNPTNIDVDERGRVWVCEAQNYRLPFNPTFKERTAGDRILILEDTDHDGVADTKKVFYQGSDINAALGIVVLGDRVIVSSSPNVLVFHDTDRDDVPERKEVLFSEIRGIDDDHGIHAFVFGPDGRLYFNFGNAGSQIRDKDGNPVIDHFGRKIETHKKPYQQGMAFRCLPDGSQVEVLGYNFRNIYELCVNSYGSVFQSDNDDDGNRGVRINYIIEYGNYGYRDQITGAGWREPRVGMHDEIPLRHWHQNDPGVIPNMLNTGAGSPAGITINEGTLLPEIFKNNLIHAEPGHQVVRAYLLKKNRAGYEAEIEEILKSKDKWFRPSDVCMAPDGSVFVADWHDAVVGGNGMDDIERGRIYRIAPDEVIDQYQIPHLRLETLDGAAQALTSPNHATRYQAWSSLHDAGIQAEPALLQLAENNEPVQLARAMWLLGHLPQKGLDYTASMLRNANEDLRITGIRMLRYLFPDRLTEFLKPLTSDPSQQVLREVSTALTGRCDDDAIQVWLGLLENVNLQDRWALEALCLPTDHCPDRYFDALVEKSGLNAISPLLIWRIRSTKALPHLVRMIKDPGTLTEDVPKFFRAIHFIDATDKDLLYLDILDHFDQNELILKYVLLAISPEFLRSNRRARQLILARLKSIEGSPEWFSAIKTMRLKDQMEPLWNLVESSTDSDLQRMAVTTIADLGGISLLKGKLARLSKDKYEQVISWLGPMAGNQSLGVFLLEELQRSVLDFGTKSRIIDALGNSGGGQQLLFDALNESRLPENLRISAAVKLLGSWNSKIRNEAPKILAAIPGSNLGQEPDIFSISRKTGNAAEGKGVFDQYCAMCHQVNGVGIEFGPDLTLIGDKLSRRGLYQAILYPSASINFGYEGFSITTNDEKSYQGYIVSETDQSIRIRVLSGESITIDKDQIKTRTALQHSLMTDGIYRAFESDKDLIDLVTFLETLGKSNL